MAHLCFIYAIWLIVLRLVIYRTPTQGRASGNFFHDQTPFTYDLTVAVAVCLGLVDRTVTEITENPFVWGRFSMRRVVKVHELFEIGASTDELLLRLQKR
jgi:hypothetical protein